MTIKLCSAFWNNKKAKSLSLKQSRATYFEFNYNIYILSKTNNRQLLLMGVYLQPTSSNSSYVDIYKNQLSSIAGIMNQYIESADPIIMGDFQSCPDKPLFPRTSKPNTLSTYLSQFLMDHNLTPIDIALGDGPTSISHFQIHHTLITSSFLMPLLT